jgi:hypothetical protein
MRRQSGMKKDMMDPPAAWSSGGSLYRSGIDGERSANVTLLSQVILRKPVNKL